MIKDIKSTFSGDVEEMMVDLFKSPIEILAEFMYSSMKGIGTNEINLITGLILTVKSEDVRQKVETVFYEREYLLYQILINIKVSLNLSVFY